MKLIECGGTGSPQSNQQTVADDDGPIDDVIDKIKPYFSVISAISGIKQVEVVGVIRLPFS